ncbi:hypothetical protein D3C84_453450 [compost metagenome]
MSVLDEINDRYGRGALRDGRVPRTPDRGMRRDLKSQSYTTRVDQLWKVFSR